jgi:hypothetical protein
MKPPTTKKHAQRLTGKMAALNRFISRSAERGLPFFEVLNNTDPFNWGPSQQKAFDELKAYLQNMTTLFTHPLNAKPLISPPITTINTTPSPPTTQSRITFHFHRDNRHATHKAKSPKRQSLACQTNKSYPHKIHQRYHKNKCKDRDTQTRITSASNRSSLNTEYTRGYYKKKRNIPPGVPSPPISSPRAKGMPTAPIEGRCGRHSTLARKHKRGSQQYLGNTPVSEKREPPQAKPRLPDEQILQLTPKQKWARMQNSAPASGQSAAHQ